MQALLSMDDPKIDRCLCCRQADLSSFLSLPDSPLTDSYKLTSNDSLNLPKHPISVNICRNCTHIQLSHHVSPEESYEDYLYKSRTTPGLVDSFRDYARQITSKVKGSNISILDVGSNDGSFIEACNLEGHYAVGVEPSVKVAMAANAQGRKTVISYIDSKLANVLRDQSIKVSYDVITFNNVLANIGSPDETLSIAKSLLLLIIKLSASANFSPSSIILKPWA